MLFFSRLAADVAGRTAPRMKALAPRSPLLLFCFGLLMTGSIPAYLYYIKQRAWHNDWAITGGRLRLTCRASVILLANKKSAEEVR